MYLKKTGPVCINSSWKFSNLKIQLKIFNLKIFEVRKFFKFEIFQLVGKFSNLIFSTLKISNLKFKISPMYFCHKSWKLGRSCFQLDFSFPTAVYFMFSWNRRYYLVENTSGNREMGGFRKNSPRLGFQGHLKKYTCSYGQMWCERLGENSCVFLPVFASSNEF